VAAVGDQSDEGGFNGSQWDSKCAGGWLECVDLAEGSEAKPAAPEAGHRRPTKLRSGGRGWSGTTPSGIV